MAPFRTLHLFRLTKLSHFTQGCSYMYNKSLPLLDIVPPSASNAIISKRFKSRKTSNTVHDGEDSDSDSETEDSSFSGKGTEIKTSVVSSMRLDLMLKIGLGVARKYSTKRFDSRNWSYLQWTASAVNTQPPKCQEAIRRRPKLMRSAIHNIISYEAGIHGQAPDNSANVQVTTKGNQVNQPIQSQVMSNIDLNESDWPTSTSCLRHVHVKFSIFQPLLCKQRLEGSSALVGIQSQIQVGDEIDLIKGVSPTNAAFITVGRVEILSAKPRPETDDIQVKMRRSKSLLIDNYPDGDPWKQ